MSKSIISTQHAPAPIGPYNQAIKAGPFLFISGQIAINPADGSLYTGGDIAEETKQVMSNMEAILKEAGASFDDVVKTTIFLMDMSQFKAVNDVYGIYFEDATAPARETVQVSGLPRGVQVEISAIALLKD
jgi:2-iminobutanoate/2-iminopropanoate deaminase